MLLFVARTVPCNTRYLNKNIFGVGTMSMLNGQILDVHSLSFCSERINLYLTNGFSHHYDWMSPL